jgi:nitroimidazol reductase NimA-like FMN-containing flavoprotein (pyridoxamine 5'-phosphate oxidase superfamily)
LAAAKWASCVADGKPEAIAHQEAEKLAFETVYGVTYTTNQSKGFGKYKDRKKE